MAVAHAVPGFKDEGLGIEAADAFRIALANFVILGQGGQLLRKQRRESPARNALVAAHDLGVGIVTEDFFIVADDFTTRAVESFQLFVLVAVFDEMHDPGRFHLVAMLIDECAGVVQFTCCVGNFLQQRQRFRLLQRVGGGNPS